MLEFYEKFQIFSLAQGYNSEELELLYISTVRHLILEKKQELQVLDNIIQVQ